MSKRVYILVGPTAVGKSEIAMRIAERLDAWIISADSRQVYRYMDIGTAKPSQSDRARVRHFLIDVIDPDSTFSAGAFLEYARAISRKIFHSIGTRVLFIKTKAIAALCGAIRCKGGSVQSSW